MIALALLFGLLGLYVGFLVGWYGRLALKSLATIQTSVKPKPPKRSGVTSGSYQSEQIPKKATSAIITPKTPQQLDWEASEAAKKKLYE